jgi:hypothetical protein
MRTTRSTATARWLRPSGRTSGSDAHVCRERRALRRVGPAHPGGQGRFRLSSGALGLALLGLAVGSLASLPLGGAAASHFGAQPRRAWRSSPSSRSPCSHWSPRTASCSSSRSPSGALAMGGLDVTMNTQGVSVERRYGRSVLSSFHAAFSLGALLGTAGGRARPAFPAAAGGVRRRPRRGSARLWSSPRVRPLRVPGAESPPPRTIAAIRVPPTTRGSPRRASHVTCHWRHSTSKTSLTSPIMRAWFLYSVRRGRA